MQNEAHKGNKSSSVDRKKGKYKRKPKMDKNFWENELKRELRNRFSCGWGLEEGEENITTSGDQDDTPSEGAWSVKEQGKLYDNVFIYPLYMRVKHLVGVQTLPRTKKERKEHEKNEEKIKEKEKSKKEMEQNERKGSTEHDSSYFKPHKHSRLKKFRVVLVPKVKHIHTISFEEGTALSKLASSKEVLVSPDLHATSLGGDSSRLSTELNHSNLARSDEYFNMAEEQVPCKLIY